MSLEVTQGVETASQSHLASSLERCRASGANGEVTECRPNTIAVYQLGEIPVQPLGPARDSPSPAPALLAVRYHEKCGAATYENGSGREMSSFRFPVSGFRYRVASVSNNS